MFLQHERHRLLLVHCGSTGPAALGVGGERLLKFVRQAEVIDDETAGFVPEDSIDVGDGLHQPVAAHRLVPAGSARRNP